MLILSVMLAFSFYYIINACFLDLTVKVVHLQNVSSDYKIAVTSAGGLVQFPAANLVADRNGSGTYSYIVT